ncbi:MAG: peptidylprolyl isomerase [Bacteroidales bacterium]|nr:peptidylprolyl isomerase [Bacteroidales bacterium]
MKQILLVFSLLISTMAMAQRSTIDKVVWVVGNEPILLSDIEEMRISSELQGTPIVNARCVIPEQIAIQKLYQHQAELDSVEVNESNVNAEVENRIQGYIQTFGSKENVERMAHKTISQLRSDLRTRIREQMLVQGAQQKLTSSVKVTPAEVRDFFKNTPQDSLPLIPTQVEVQIITNKPAVSREEVEDIEGRLREYARRVNTGESDFSTLAMLYSQDGSARQGGELGYSGKNQWVPEFANVAFALTDPKKVSKIVRTEFGYHIIQLIDKRGDKVNVRHILLKPNIQESEYARCIARLDSITSDIRAGKFTFEDAAAVLSDDKDTRNNQGLMVNLDREQMITTSRFQMRQLPQDIARVVDTLQVGQISRAFKWTNEAGQTVTAVVKLKHRIDAHRASITEDFQQLKNIVEDKRREEILDKWIAQKIKSTYIRIDKDWQDCNFRYKGWVK